MFCPKCNGELNGAGTFYTCKSCGTAWDVDFKCEVCGSEPEQHSSCGSVSFFCKTCNNLKSRNTMEKSFSRRT